MSDNYKQLLIHVTLEIVVLGIIVYYFYHKNSALETRLEAVEARLVGLEKTQRALEQQHVKLLATPTPTPITTQTFQPQEVHAPPPSFAFPNFMNASGPIDLEQAMRSSSLLSSFMGPINLASFVRPPTGSAAAVPSSTVVVEEASDDDLDDELADELNELQPAASESPKTATKTK